MFTYTLACTTYGATFQELQDHHLSYASDDMIGSISEPVQCMDLCIAETNYVCRVAELYHPNSYCLLYSDETFSTNDFTLNPSVSYDHYMRDCAAPSTTPTSLPQTPPPPTTPPSVTELSMTTTDTSVPPAAIFSLCIDNSDCVEIPDAVCRYGNCQCSPGMSYDPSLNSCVPGRFNLQITILPYALQAKKRL